MAEHRPLRAAGRARGVDEGGEVAALDLGVLVDAAAAAQRRRRVAALGGDDLAQVRQLVAALPRGRPPTSGVQTTTVASESARIADLLARGQRRVDRVEDRPEPEDRPPDLEVVGAVGKDDADDVALLDPELAQPGGDLGHPGVELAEGPLLIGVADEALVRRSPRRARPAPRAGIRSRCAAPGTWRQLGSRSATPSKNPHPPLWRSQSGEVTRCIKPVIASKRHRAASGGEDRQGGDVAGGRRGAGEAEADAGAGDLAAAGAVAQLQRELDHLQDPAGPA